MQSAKPTKSNHSNPDWFELSLILWHVNIPRVITLTRAGFSSAIELLLDALFDIDVRQVVSSGRSI
jgi:hypothetical protein